MKPWAEEVIDEMEKFPKGRYDDLTDSTTQAIAHLRARGMADTDDDYVYDEASGDAVTYQIVGEPEADVFRVKDERARQKAAEAQAQGGIA